VTLPQGSAVDVGRWLEMFTAGRSNAAGEIRLFTKPKEAGKVIGLPLLHAGAAYAVEYQAVAIIVLVAPTPDAPSDSQVLRDYQALEPLSAAKNHRISVLKSEEAFANGPRILTLAEHLKQQLAQMFPTTPATRFAIPDGGAH